MDGDWLLFSLAIVNHWEVHGDPELKMNLNENIHSSF